MPDAKSAWPVPVNAEAAPLIGMNGVGQVFAYATGFEICGNDVGLALRACPKRRRVGFKRSEEIQR